MHRQSNVISTNFLLTYFLKAVPLGGGFFIFILLNSDLTILSCYPYRINHSVCSFYISNSVLFEFICCVFLTVFLLFLIEYFIFL